MSLVVRSSLPSDRILPDVRRAVQSVDRTLAIHDVRMMTDIVQDSLQLERVSSLVMTFFALGALLMATLGIYGVVSYGVRQRTVELGTRMALGAVGRDLMRMVVGGGLRMAAIGMAVGAVALIGSVWLLARALDIRDVTWVPFALSIGVVAFISVAASYVPAWRASLLSPMVAIRDESSSAWQSMRRRFRRAMEDVKGAVTIGSSRADAADAADRVRCRGARGGFVRRCAAKRAVHVVRAARRRIGGPAREGGRCVSRADRDRSVRVWRVDRAGRRISRRPACGLSDAAAVRAR